MANHLNNLQLEAGVEDSSFLFRHGDCPGDFHLSVCAKLLEQDTFDIADSMRAVIDYATERHRGHDI
jgi:hypothetical protein